MPEYHIGSLDEASLAVLADADASVEADPSSEPRAVFLQSKVWSKAILASKRPISDDTKVFSFTLDHPEQSIGLPTGQHLMMRLRDPATREAIIRAYTPISEERLAKGCLDVLVKIYRDSADRKGGRMTQALDAIPVGHFVDFKGPVGKFEYLGKGQCTISGRGRKVQRFIMVCAGSGITPIFQVLRAVLSDKDDVTRCLVLDGNRVEEDILCREELDAMAAANPDRCRLLYTLTRPGPDWTGRTGRMDRALFDAEVGQCMNTTTQGAGGDLVLICGPESMEKSVHEIFLGLGWKDNDLLFF